ncbi:hypothetical protein KBD71_04395 [Candidatus Woesebacteria bacterium]|nr:hypothetical protein [Candidatus Woesebacteria bacterium]
MTDLFVSTLDVRSESTSYYIVTYDAEYLQKKLSYDVRRSDAINTPVAATSAATLGLTTAGVTTTYSISSGNLMLTQSGQSYQLNSNGTSISDFSILRIGSGNATDTLRISYTIASRTMLRGTPAESKSVQFTVGGR